MNDWVEQNFYAIRFICILLALLILYLAFEDSIRLPQPVLSLFGTAPGKEKPATPTLVVEYPDTVPREEYESLKQELQQVQSQVSWRKLSELQVATISQWLWRAKGTIIDICWVPGADDGWAYAQQFVNVFEKAEWTIGHTSQLVGPDAEGIIILAETENDKKAGRVIQDALKEAGIESAIESEPTIGGLALLIGRRDFSEVDPDANSE